jgi:hypothetical protein
MSQAEALWESKSQIAGLERLSKVMRRTRGLSELQLPANFGEKLTTIGPRSSYIAANQSKSLYIPRRHYRIRK